jgi:hypothetical protein
MQIIENAVEIMRTCFGGTKVEITSDKLFREEPSEYAKAGRLYADIEIEKVKIKLYYSDAEDMHTPIGQLIAEEYVWKVVGEIYKSTPLSKMASMQAHKSSINNQ